MKYYENKLIKNGLTIIAGVDEVGRGSLFGPVVAAAVILPNDYVNNQIKDSKVLSPQTREQLYDEIIENAISYSFAFVSSKVIDKVNIKNASKLAMEKAIEKLKINPEHVLVDYEKLNISNSTSIVKGDSLSQTIAAASILAKVKRDNYIKKMSKKYSEYNLNTNKGYPSKQHYDAILKFGWTKMHRKTFNPIKKIIQEGKYFNLN